MMLSVWIYQCIEMETKQDTAINWMEKDMSKDIQHIIEQLNSVDILIGGNIVVV